MGKGKLVVVDPLGRVDSEPGMVVREPLGSVESEPGMVVREPLGSVLTEPGTVEAEFGFEFDVGLVVAERDVAVGTGTRVVDPLGKVDIVEDPVVVAPFGTDDDAPPTEEGG